LNANPKNSMWFVSLVKALTMSGLDETLRATFTTNFNSMLGEFSRKLIGAFPSHAGEFKAVYNRVLLAITLDKSMAIDAFSKALDEEMMALVNHGDDSFFSSGRAGEMALFNGIDMRACWADTNQGVRDSVWEYMRLLVTITVRYRSIGCRSGAYMGGIGNPDRRNLYAGLASTLEDTARKINEEADWELSPTELIEKITKKMGLDMSQLDKVDMKANRQQVASLMQEVFMLPQAEAEQFADDANAHLRSIKYMHDQKMNR
jgi:hypothetical protein